MIRVCFLFYRQISSLFLPFDPRLLRSNVWSWTEHSADNGHQQHSNSSRRRPATRLVLVPTRRSLMAREDFTRSRLGTLPFINTFPPIHLCLEPRVVCGPRPYPQPNTVLCIEAKLMPNTRTNAWVTGLKLIPSGRTRCLDTTG